MLPATTSLYSKAMGDPNAHQWAQAIIEELDQLEKNDTWTLVPKQEMELGHRVLGASGFIKSNEMSTEILRASRPDGW